jgi:hypothetical protein
MRNRIFLTFCATAFLVACNKDSLQPNGFASTEYGTTATVKMSNSWWVNVSLPGTGYLTPLPLFFQTYNTAANSIDSMWLDNFNNLVLADEVGFPYSLGTGPDSLAGLGVDFKCKVAINYSALTFSTVNAVNYYGDTASTFVTVIGGRILPNAGHSLSGNPVDSIYMRAVFSNAPQSTDTFTIAGVARTEINADDY